MQPLIAVGSPCAAERSAAQLVALTPLEELQERAVEVRVQPHAGDARAECRHVTAHPFGAHMLVLPQPRPAA